METTALQALVDDGKEGIESQEGQESQKQIEGKEQIGEEELLEIGADLEKKKASPEDAIRILRVLSYKVMTPELLKATLIGKKLTSVSEDPENYAGDEVLLTKVKEL